MTVYIVMDGNCDGNWVVAAYLSKDLAAQHSKEMECFVVEKIILNEIAPEARKT